MPGAPSKCSIEQREAMASVRQRKNIFSFVLSLAQGLLLPETYLLASFKKQLFAVFFFFFFSSAVMPALDIWAQLNFSNAL